MKKRVIKRREARIYRGIHLLARRLKDTHGMPGAIHGLFTPAMDEERAVYLSFFTTTRTRRRMAKRNHATTS